MMLTNLDIDMEKKITGKEAETAIVYPEGKDKNTVSQGDTISIGDEKFMVLTNSNEKILAIPYYNLIIDQTPIKQANDTTDDSHLLIKFAESNGKYWDDYANINMNGANNVQEKILAYQAYLQGDLGATNVNAEIGRYYDDSISTGYNLSDYNNVNVPGQSDVKLLNPSQKAYYYLGSSSNQSSVWMVGRYGNILASAYDSNYNAGIRPIIIITK